jgi:hypothetical protein
LKPATPWTDAEIRFWSDAADALYAAQHLECQLALLNTETDPDDALRVRRRTDAAVATGKRLAALLTRLEGEGDESGRKSLQRPDVRFDG